MKLRFLLAAALLAVAAVPAQAQFQTCNYCDVFAFTPDPFDVTCCDTGTIIIRGIGYRSTSVNGCSATPRVEVRSTRPDRVTIVSFTVLSDSQIRVNYNVPCNATEGILGIDVTIDDDPTDSIVPYACGNNRMRVHGICGNGNLDAGEECDDGNLNNNDGCSSTCKREPAPPVCGNGVVEPPEQCDDGNRNNNDGCSSTCQREPAPAVCGNGVVEPPEECDDGNQRSSDGCSANCRRETVVLAVVFDGFGAERRGQEVVISWKTAAEVGTVGFVVEARDAFGVTRDLEPTVVAHGAGVRYEAVDDEPGARAYRVVEFTSDGRGTESPWFSVPVGAASGGRGRTGK